MVGDVFWCFFIDFDRVWSILVIRWWLCDVLWCFLVNSLLYSYNFYFYFPRVLAFALAFAGRAANFATRFFGSAAPACCGGRTARTALSRATACNGAAGIWHEVYQLARITKKLEKLLRFLSYSAEGIDYNRNNGGVCKSTSILVCWVSVILILFVRC